MQPGRMPSILIRHVRCVSTLLTLLLVVANGKWTRNEKPNPPVETGNEKRLVFLDSDGGSDDLAAIIQLVRDENTELMAISCVYGNVALDQACSNILRTLNLLNRTDIPVYPGCDSPLTSIAIQDGFFALDGMGNVSESYPLPTNVTLQTIHAVSAMIDAANKHTGKITLLSLGPLTNLAVVLKLDPYFSFKLEDHIVMGGTMLAMGNIEAVSEFNFYEDVEAAMIVFSKAAFPITIFPFELCLSAGPSWDKYNAWVSTNTTLAIFMQQIYDYTNVNSQLMNATAFSPCDLMTTSTMLFETAVIKNSTLRSAKIEQCGTLTRGELVVDYRTSSTFETATIALITAVNADALFATWKNMLN